MRRGQRGTQGEELVMECYCFCFLGEKEQTREGYIGNAGWCNHQKRGCGRQGKDDVGKG
jgi:hypothetical protein